MKSSHFGEEWKEHGVREPKACGKRLSLWGFCFASYRVCNSLLETSSGLLCDLEERLCMKALENCNPQYHSPQTGRQSRPTLAPTNNLFWMFFLVEEIHGSMIYYYPVSFFWCSKWASGWLIHMLNTFSWPSLAELEINACPCLEDAVCCRVGPLGGTLGNLVLLPAVSLPH